jgi:prepilin peptidase CpaA
MGGAHIGEFLAFVTIFGGALSVLILGYRRMIPVSVSFPPWAQRLHLAGGPIPYGIAIAAGGLMLFPATELFLSIMV